ncbi:hypothetical protein RCL_jg9376.t1 [Rhizophagus clarus]|uniref:Uncharacterized protein n=1 Tax=Rhizophagus clarus TaxID=94130 RepID=A0A8H3M569_9GLOM|nr:hypothetical protein RCL_jg9376.t1 [Rhizophagus clarus]
MELKKQIKHLEKNNERLEEQIINLQKDFKDFKISQLILSEYRDWIHVNDIEVLHMEVYPALKKHAIALGLLQDDEERDQCLK